MRNEYETLAQTGSHQELLSAAQRALLTGAVAQCDRDLRFLLRRENRKTWQCVLSYRTIGEAVHLSVNTVRKYVAELEDRQLIRTERTTVITRDGRRQNGCLRYTVLPIQMAIDDFHGRQLRRAEELQARWLAANRTEGQGEGGGGPC